MKSFPTAIALLLAPSLLPSFSVALPKGAGKGGLLEKFAVSNEELKLLPLMGRLGNISTRNEGFRREVGL